MKLIELRQALGDIVDETDASLYRDVLAWIVSDDDSVYPAEPRVVVRISEAVLETRWATMINRDPADTAQKLTALLPGGFRPWSESDWRDPAHVEFV